MASDVGFCVSGHHFGLDQYCRALDAVADAGFDHLLATRLRRDRACGEAIDGDTAWVEIPQHRCRAAGLALADGTRAVAVESDARARRDNARRAETAAATMSRNCSNAPGSR